MNWAQAIFIAAASLDVSSTAHNLHRGQIEANPLYSSIRNQTISVSLTLAAQYAGEYWLAHKIERSHPKIAKTLLLLSAGEAIHCGAGNLTRWSQR